MNIYKNNPKKQYVWKSEIITKAVILIVVGIIFIVILSFIITDREDMGTKIIFSAFCVVIVVAVAVHIFESRHYAWTVIFEDDCVKCVFLKRIKRIIPYEEVAEFGFFDHKATKNIRDQFIYISRVRLSDANRSSLFWLFRFKKNVIIMENRNEYVIIPFLKVKCPVYNNKILRFYFRCYYNWDGSNYSFDIYHKDEWVDKSLLPISSALKYEIYDLNKELSQNNDGYAEYGKYCGRSSFTLCTKEDYVSFFNRAEDVYEKLKYELKPEYSILCDIEYGKQRFLKYHYFTDKYSISEDKKTFILKDNQISFRDEIHDVFFLSDSWVIFLNRNVDENTGTKFCDWTVVSPVDIAYKQPHNNIFGIDKYCNVIWNIKKITTPYLGENPNVNYSRPEMFSDNTFRTVTYCGIVFDIDVITQKVVFTTAKDIEP